MNIIVPYSAGGATDIVTRVIATELTNQLKSTVVVENKPGGNSNIAADAVARAEPDGYTLLATGPWLLINQFLETGRRWSPEQFMPVARVGVTDNILVVPASSPAKTLKQYVDMAKAAGDNHLQYGSPGFGSTQRMAVEMFANAAGIQLEAVQYKGAPPIIPDLLTGRVGMSILAASNVTGHVREGKLRALATASDERNPDTPDIPTVIESGYKNVEALSWFGFNAPAGTPPERIKKLANAMQRALAKPEVQKQLKSADTRIAFMGPDDFGTYLKDEKRRWGAVAESLDSKGKQ
ncbi:tripartite tricarboxylate transporter substrate binding protein [Allopusillimonas soli]|uniref:Tripartite tricarboxylate transporter substrate binding protein n=1 Tax=Allopusillimonas soli TaxID=659016 RepID=A0A853FA78_9BURK|nr:tripartite tricarboxylate transporter substrate binding protein [Allopusillimonas soli]TEA75635.1 tripartite tricarboxylate transporter substrate binding protein [Allopusillimonas soli]